MRTQWMKWSVIAVLVWVAGYSAVAAYFEFDADRAKTLQSIHLNSDLTKLLGSPKLSSIKIAILDNGFMGFEKGGRSLPSTAQLIENPAQSLGMKDIKSNPLGMGDHGLAMAQTVWAMTGLDQANAPQFFLVNANGGTNFKYAVDWTIKNKIDIVLYAQNFEIGNMNGSGFINAKVNEALDAGILWINAAGNYGESLYYGPIKKSVDGYVMFSFLGEEPRKSLRFKVEEKKDSTSLVITAVWNDLPESDSVATTKDLDLVLLDSKGEKVMVAQVDKNGVKTQVPAMVNFRSDGKGEKSADVSDLRGYSTLPREQVELMLNQGEYQIQLKDRSGNFGKNDSVRVMVLSSRDYDPRTQNRGINFIDRTQGCEIFTPGDNPRVVTVGDHSPVSSVGPNSDDHIKPDILVTDSRIELSDGRENLMGSSTAAAIFAGTVALMKVKNPALTQEDLFNYIKGLKEAQRAYIPTLRGSAPVRLPGRTRL